MEKSITENLPFYCFFVKEDYDLSVILSSGWCMKYSINIEDFFKVQFLQYLKHHKAIKVLSNPENYKKSDADFRKSLICKHIPSHHFYSKENKTQSYMIKIIHKVL